MKIIWNVAAGAETRLAMAAALAVRAGGVDVEGGENLAVLGKFGLRARRGEAVVGLVDVAGGLCGTGAQDEHRRGGRGYPEDGRQTTVGRAQSSVPLFEQLVATEPT